MKRMLIAAALVAAAATPAAAGTDRPFLLEGVPVGAPAELVPVKTAGACRAGHDAGEVLCPLAMDQFLGVAVRDVEIEIWNVRYMKPLFEGFSLSFERARFDDLQARLTGLYGAPGSVLNEDGWRGARWEMPDNKVLQLGYEPGKPRATLKLYDNSPSDDYE